MTANNKINYSRLHAVSKGQQSLKSLEELNVEEVKYRTLKQRNAADASLNSTCKSSSSSDNSSVSFNGQRSTFNDSFNGSSPRTSTPIEENSTLPSFSVNEESETGRK